MKEKKENFVELIAEMRDLQNKYFKTRAHGYLIRCKELEKKVDEAVKSLKASNEKNAQPSLFK